MLSQSVLETLMRSSHFGVPQTRSRVYIVLVQKKLLDVAAMKSLVHVITEFFPGSLSTTATLPQVTQYVKSILETLDEKPTMPEHSKDPKRVWGILRLSTPAALTLFRLWVSDCVARGCQRQLHLKFCVFINRSCQVYK